VEKTKVRTGPELKKSRERHRRRRWASHYIGVQGGSKGVKGEASLGGGGNKEKKRAGE